MSGTALLLKSPRLRMRICIAAAIALVACVDYEASRLKILSESKYSEPGVRQALKAAQPDDAFKQRILQSLKTKGGDNPEVTIGDTALNSLIRLDKNLLLRYLSTNPAWRVFYDHGSLFATRRFEIDSVWHYELHGYYGDFNLQRWPDSAIPGFQSRTTIGLDGRTWANHESGETRFSRGEKKGLRLTPAQRSHYSSDLVLDIGNYTLELFEESPAKERVLTKGIISFLNNEFSHFERNPDIDSMNGIPSIQGQAGPIFEIYGRRGLYNSFIGVNPGEPGMIYLKAFDLVDSAILSEESLKSASNERVGWSEDPNTLFYSNTTFTIYEGDFDRFYVARFEIWFVPDSGENQRKVLEKNFKIEGWER